MFLDGGIEALQVVRRKTITQAISGEINDIAAVNNLFTAFSLALCCNFIVVTLMCLKRIDVCYQVISRF